MTLTARNARNLAGQAVSLPWPPNAAVLARNAVARRRNRPWLNHLGGDRSAIERHAEAGLDWICRSQDEVGSGGVGCFRFQGWTPGYPEVTGYIIPTFFDYSRAFARKSLVERAVRMADWELGIQHPGGGFESWYEGEGRPPVVFNTGQVIRGLLRTGLETGEDRYLEAARRAGDWILSVQGPDGSFAAGNYLGMTRVYDAYSTAALAQLADALGEERYGAGAIRSAEFALANQTDNGWFEFCDNTPSGNHRPSTHTLCYTADGLIEIGTLLGEPRFVEAGELTARALLEQIEPGGLLPGRFDRNWRPRASSVVLTGSSQLGWLLTGMYRRTGEERLIRASRELLDYVAWAQDLNSIGGPNRRGAVAGSFPVWGRYVPLKYPSWATKFFLDHLRLMLEDEPAGTQ